MFAIIVTPAIVENNQGSLLSVLGRFEAACVHLDRARNLFELLQDHVRRAQVDETLAQLYLASEKYELAETVDQPVNRDTSRSAGKMHFWQKL